MTVCLDCDHLQVMNIRITDDLAYSCKKSEDNLYSTTNKFKNTKVAKQCPYTLEHVVIEDIYSKGD